MLSPLSYEGKYWVFNYFRGPANAPAHYSNTSARNQENVGLS